ncbi:unnamed protein product, partial [Mesorhabditis belari]|uniref:Major facilitator superfamily (MFS) profile domain-containing protein n=1 Tax=Mesorhabditis belari TaxID=2138241 RepID=A0AAF3E9Q1_9BILA
MTRFDGMIVNQSLIENPVEMMNSTKPKEMSNETYPPLFSPKAKRFRVLLMIAFSMFAQGIMKTNLSMAMVCMVNTTKSSVETIKANTDTSTGSCIVESDSEKKAKMSYDGTFLWSNEEQSAIFAAFFWGGLVSVCMCTWLSNKFGPTRVLLAGGLLNVIASFLTPIAADMGVFSITVVRAVMGAGQGIQYPLGATVAAAWFPKEEKSTAIAVYTNGNQMSYVIAMLVSSQICQFKAIGGWRAIFYIYGAIGALMCLLWWWVVTDTPYDAKDISEVELTHICGPKSSKKTATSTPWKEMLTSPLMLTLIACTVGQSVSIITLTTYLPSYFKHVQHMDLTNNGFWSALPFLCQTAMKFVVGGCADGLKRRYPKKIDTITKCSNCLATFGCALCLGVVSLLPCGHSFLAVLLITLATSCLSGYTGGYFTALISVAPLHTAAVNSVSRIFGQLASAGTPYFVGFITKTNSAFEWLIVFFTIGAILVASGVMFLIFGTVTPQPWSLPKAENKENEKNEL